MDNKKTIYEFAKQYSLCTVSTCSDNQPESALVDFVINENLEIFFNTYTTSRKHKNILLNPKVSIVIGSGDDLKTLQYEGIAQQLAPVDERQLIEQYKDDLRFFRRWKVKYMKYFKVEPTWVRLSDFSDYPPTTIEV